MCILCVLLLVTRIYISPPAPFCSIWLHFFSLVFEFRICSPLTSCHFHFIHFCFVSVRPELVSALPSRPRPPATAPGVSVRPPAAGCSAASSPFYSAAARPPSPSSCTAETESDTFLRIDSCLSASFFCCALKSWSICHLERRWVCTSWVCTHFSMASSLSHSACCRTELSSAPFPDLTFWMNKQERPGYVLSQLS